MLRRVANGVAPRNDVVWCERPARTWWLVGARCGGAGGRCSGAAQWDGAVGRRSTATPYRRCGCQLPSCCCPSRTPPRHCEEPLRLVPRRSNPAQPTTSPRLDLPGSPHYIEHVTPALAFIDVFDTEIEASASAVYEALSRHLGRSLGTAGAQVASGILGCAHRGASLTTPPVEGQVVNGFVVAEAQAPNRLFWRGAIASRAIGFPSRSSRSRRRARS